MRAIAETALLQQRTKLRKARIEMLRRHSPHSDFSKTRRVDDIARIGKRMQQRAFCESCHRAVKDLKSSEFTRLLLTRQGRSAARRRSIS